MKASFFRTFRRKDSKQSMSSDSSGESFGSPGRTRSPAKDPKSFWLDDDDRRAATASPSRSRSTQPASPIPFMKAQLTLKRPPPSPSGERARSTTSVPSRPPRPPPLYPAPHSSEATPTMLSPKRRPGLVNEHGMLTSPRSPRLARSRDERGVPQLDGIWDDFLTDLNEDRGPLKPSTPAVMPNSTTRPRADSLKTKSKPDSPVQPRLRRVGSQPQLFKDASADERELPPLPTLSTIDDPLALFPTPPPLKIKKKTPTLVLRATSTLPSVPPSPSLSFSSQSSVTADSALSTPTTPVFKVTSGKIITPVLRPRRSKDLLNEPRLRAPPMGSLPSSPDPETMAFPEVPHSPGMQGTRRIYAPKITHSVSQVYPSSLPSLKVHRPTSSDSTSSAESRKMYKPFLPPTHSYQDISQPPSPVNWGYAL